MIKDLVKKIPGACSLYQSVHSLIADPLNLRPPLQWSFEHRTNGYATHQPVLYEAVLRTRGPILELGIGRGSTPMLDAIADRILVSVDDNVDYVNAYRKRFNARYHSYECVHDWRESLHHWSYTRWGVVFIDCGSWAIRADAIRALKDTASYIVIHDNDYLPLHGLIDYDAEFKQWRQYEPCQPWPYPPTGPPTLLGTNKGLELPDIDYSRY